MNNSLIYNLGLIGWPVEHSLSPLIHKTALKAVGLQGDYRIFHVHNLPKGKEELEEILILLRRGEIQGLNVTIPHKQNVIPFLDKLTPCAQEIGAVNLIFHMDGQLIGDNTDAIGFLNDLKRKFKSEKRGKIALVLGAGGSARAVTYALLRDGWQVNVASRRLKQAQSLLVDLSEDQQFEIKATHLASRNLLNLAPALIVNTTPVGMAPNIFESIWPSVLPFPKDCFIYDLVYNPIETLFIQLALESGLEVSNGLGMLVEQAALGFEKWTGKSAPRKVMQDAISKHLNASSSKKGD